MQFHAVGQRMAIISTILSGLVKATVLPYTSTCHNLPGDSGWPSAQDWKQLNYSIGGRLIAGEPLGRVCHGSNFDATACMELQEEWNEPPVYFEDPVNVMSPYWQNNSCSPFISSHCTLGDIASYAVNVSQASDIIAGFKFAKEKNIRFTVKNTGHDYLGRSTGRGALAMWTHNLKNISFLNYTSETYTGPAVKLGAGVQAYEVYQAAASQGLRVTGGFCSTVGIVGGYVQGAGHGPLEGLYGLAADNTLEFEVVTADGSHLVATPTNHNSDLYWALNGGGGSTYAVVISQTTKAHADGPVAGATLTFQNAGNDDAYWSAVERWHKHLLIFDDIPGFNSFWGVTNETYVLYYTTLPGANASIMSAALNPFVQELVTLKLPYTYEVTGNSTYYEHFMQYTPGLPFGEYLTNSTLGGRLIPRSTVQNNLVDLIATFRNITNTGTHQFRVNGIASNVTHARVGNSPGSNAILPAWRDSLYWLNMDVYFDPAAPNPLETILRLQAQMNKNQDLLKVLSPGGGSYINEGTFDNVDWKEDYYGENYDRLLSIKKKYDPDFILYGPASVGSDHWVIASDGRLCETDLK